MRICWGMLREWSQKILICISSSIFLLHISQNMGKCKLFNFPTSILIFYLVILNCKYVNQFNWIAPLLHFTSRINVLDCFGWHYLILTYIKYYLNRIGSNYDLKKQKILCLIKLRILWFMHIWFYNNHSVLKP